MSNYNDNHNSNNKEDIAVFLNCKIGILRDDTQSEINEMESWINHMLVRPRNVTKEKRCEVCNSREEQYNLECHHIAGRKHDHRTITICRRCHAELSESQKTWDVRWLQANQPTDTRSAFFLLGLHDVLILRSRYTASEVCYLLASYLRQKISDLLQFRQQGAVCA